MQQEGAQFSHYGSRILTYEHVQIVKLSLNARHRESNSACRALQFPGHERRTNKCRHIAAADLRGVVRVIDVTSQVEVAELKHGAKTKGIAFSPDGKYVATGASDHWVRIWTTQGLPWRMLKQADEVNGLAFSPDSRRLAVTTGSFDRMHHNGLAVWDLKSQSVTLEIKDQPDPFEGTSFSMDGRYIVTTGQDFTARIWDSTRIREVALPLFHDLPVWSAAFSSDGRFLVTGGEDNSVRVWEWLSGRELVRLTQRGAARLVAFSPNDRNIVAASFDPSGQMLEFRFWVWKAEELIDEACSRVRHGLSEQEWHVFFGAEKYATVCRTPRPLSELSR